jgi:peptidyl-prolyl cis-trans isomerase C
MKRGAMKPSVLWILPAALAALASGCNEKALEQVPSSGVEPVAGLSAEQASKIVAKVGERTITLGDFARTLERMDPFDRLRYQTKERRHELLQEMIDVELLAQEARRRGLDKRPEVEDALRQLYRDALLQKVRDSLPPPGAISADEVKAYYEANADRYVEPERRRVSAIVMTSKAEADKVLKQAQGVKTAVEWGELFLKNSVTAPKTKGPNDPVDLAGDLGIVGPPGDPKGGNTKVPEPVRAAVFKLSAVGQVADAVIEAEGKLYVVRLSGQTAGHKRTLAEADRTIRVAILQQKLNDLEKKLDDELRAKFPVQVDDKVVGDIALPAALVDAATAPSQWSKKQEEAAGAGTAKPDGAPPPPAPAPRGDGGR